MFEDLTRLPPLWVTLDTEAATMLDEGIAEMEACPSTGLRDGPY
jgi:hypothetical protein